MAEFVRCVLGPSALFSCQNDENMTPKQYTRNKITHQLSAGISREKHCTKWHYIISPVFIIFIMNPTICGCKINEPLYLTLPILGLCIQESRNEFQTRLANSVSGSNIATNDPINQRRFSSAKPGSLCDNVTQ